MKEEHITSWPPADHESVLAFTVHCITGDHQAWRASAAAFPGGAEAVGAPGILVHRLPVPHALHAVPAVPAPSPGAPCLPLSCSYACSPAAVKAAL